MRHTLIAQASYKSPVTLQTAMIRIRKNAMATTGADYFIGASIGGENDATGYAWTANADTESQARTLGNTWHAQLKTVYGMRKL